MQQKEYYSLYINNIVQSKTLEPDENYSNIADQLEKMMRDKLALPKVEIETLDLIQESMNSIQEIAEDINSIVEQQLNQYDNDDLKYRYIQYIDYRRNLPFDQYKYARQVYEDLSQQTEIVKQATDIIYIQETLEQYYKIDQQLRQFTIYIEMQQESSELLNKLKQDINYLEFKLLRKQDSSSLSLQRPRNELSITESVVSMIDQLSILCRFLVPDKLQFIQQITPTTIVNSEYTIILICNPHLGLITASNKQKQANRYFVPASRMALQGVYDQVFGTREYTYKDEMLVQALNLLNILHKINKFCQQAGILKFELNIEGNQIKESINKFNDYTERVGYFDYYLFMRQFEITLY